MLMYLVFWGSVNGWISTCTGHGLVIYWHLLFRKKNPRYFEKFYIFQLFNFNSMGTQAHVDYVSKIKRGTHSKSSKVEKTCSLSPVWQQGNKPPVACVVCVSLCGGVITALCEQVKQCLKADPNTFPGVSPPQAPLVWSSTYFIPSAVLSLLIFPERYLTHILAHSHKTLLFRDDTMAFPTRELADSIGWCAVSVQSPIVAATQCRNTSPPLQYYGGGSEEPFSASPMCQSDFL